VTLQEVVEDVVTMCASEVSSSNIMTLIGVHGYVSTFDCSRHVTLWTDTLQVSRLTSVIFSCLLFSFSYSFNYLLIANGSFVFRALFTAK